MNDCIYIIAILTYYTLHTLPHFLTGLRQGTTELAFRLHRVAKVSNLHAFKKQYVFGSYFDGKPHRSFQESIYSEDKL